MKKLLSIAVALAITLSMLVALPVGAVSQGTISVVLSNPIAGEASTYTIRFHNDGLLLGDDNQFIDVMFPIGTTFGGAQTVTVTKGPAFATDNTIPVDTTFIVVGTKTLRIYLDDGQMIDKCERVRIVVTDVINPASCNRHLQIGTSVAGPFASPDYTIFSVKIDLLAGKNLISLPAYPEDTAIEVVLASLFAEVARTAAFPTPFKFSVWYWDSWAKEWVIYASDTSFSDLTTMEAGKAYFIKVNYGFSFLFKGDAYPVSQGPPQVWCYPVGWSMIGPASQADIWASEYLKDAMLPWPHQNTYAVSTIFGFDNAPLVQQFFNTTWAPGQKDVAAWKTDVDEGDFELETGEGYFMYFIGEACIVPPIN